MSPLLISIAVFVGVAALVGGLSLLLRDRSGNKIEDRLDLLAGLKQPTTQSQESVLRDGSMLADLQKGPGLLEQLFSRFGDPALFLQQADSTLTLSKFTMISAVLGGVGMVLPLTVGAPPLFLPISGAAFFMLPAVYLLLRRQRRLKKFAAQLPDAMELIARALRAGHSLGSGMNLVAEEMPEPIGREFERAFEEQNLGMPLEETLKALTLRVPNLDLKFFTTAVILQRQSGGDLAEILDKIGNLIRERFKIWGQVQALTGEGRLSGIVLLALPPLLFLAVYYLNQEYVMLLFTDEMGKKMLAGAVVLQIVGALVIRKIVNIKV